MYKLIIDNGKPYVLNCLKHEIKTELEKVFKMSLIDEPSHLDIQILNDLDEDITNSEFITKLIEDLQNE